MARGALGLRHGPREPVAVAESPDGQTQWALQFAMEAPFLLTDRPRSHGWRRGMEWLYASFARALRSSMERVALATSSKTDMGARTASRCVIAVAALCAGLIVPVALAAPAAACDITYHCYGVVTSRPDPIHGVHVSIEPDYICAPSSGTFLTEETWLTDDHFLTGYDYWVEAGFLYVNNANIKGIPANGRYLFWGDQKPGYGFHGHIIEVGPTLTRTYISIQWDSNQTFSIHTFNPTENYQYAGTSVNNGMSSTRGDYGEEITSTSVNGHGTWRDVSFRQGGFGVFIDGTHNPVVREYQPPYFTWADFDVSFRAGTGSGC